MQNKNRLFSFFNISTMLFLILFHGVNNLIWLKLNKFPLVDADAFHLVSSLKYLDIISHPNLDIFFRLVQVDFFYPPLFPFIASIFGLLFGKSALVFVMANVLFMSGTFVCLYMIGYKIGDIRIGMLASYLLSFFPAFFYISRIFILEIALCFMVTASVLTLIYSDGFKKRKPCVILGIFFSLGLLTKQPYVIFILGPVIFMFIDSYFSADVVLKRRVIINLMIAVLTGFFLASFWYYPNLIRMMPVLLKATTDSSLVPYEIKFFSLRSLFFYLYQLLDTQLLLFFCLVFIYAFLVIKFRKIKNKLLNMFILWLVVSYFLLTIFPNKFFYYGLPYFPAIALISAYGLLSIERSFLRKVMVIFVVAVGFLQFFLVSYTRFDHPSSLHIGEFEFRYLPFGMRSMTVKYHPINDDQGINRIIDNIIRNSKDRVFVLGVLSIDPNVLPKIGDCVKDNYVGVNYDSLRCNLMLRNISCDVIRLENYPEQKRVGAKDVDFIIAPGLLTDINKYGLDPGRYLLIKKFVMPDGSKVYLYIKKI